MDAKTEDRGLERFLADRLQVPAVSLRRLELNCVSRAYEAIAGERRIFVKWGENDGARATAFLRAVESPLLSAPLAGFPVRFGSQWVSAFPWREIKTVPLERMTEVQFRSFWAGYLELSRLLQKAPPGTVGRPVDVDAQLTVVREYAARVPAARFLLRRLLSLGPEDLIYPADVPRVVVHGDFHCGNIAFCGDGLAGFLDFDLIAFGAQVEDLAFLVLERAKRLKGPSRVRRLLAERLKGMVRDLGHPASEWRIAMNRIRVCTAARLIDRHPDRLRAAFNVFRRDKKFRDLLDAVRP